MLLKSTLLAAAVAVAATAQAQRPAPADAHAFYNTSYSARNSGSFSLNHRLFSVSYGFPTLLNDGFGGRIGFGPVMARFEAPIRDEVGIAALAQIGARNSGGYYNDKSFAFGFGGMGFYHFNKLIPLRDLDVYAGLGIGINFTHVNREGGHRKDGNYVDPVPVGAIGARYYFSPRFAGFAEAGYTGMSSVNLGLTWRL